MTTRGKLLTELAEVVNLAVEDDLHRSVFVPHRLAGVGRQIDDPQPAEREAGGPLRADVHTGAVRAAMRQLIGHRAQPKRRNALTIESHFTADAAHRAVATPVSDEAGVGEEHV